jgi:hypothetical protein
MNDDVEEFKESREYTTARAIPLARYSSINGGRVARPTSLPSEER